MTSPEVVPLGGEHLHGAAQALARAFFDDPLQCHVFPDPDDKAWLTALPPAVDTLHIPSVSEPFLACVTSGEVDFQEREDGRPRAANSP